MNMPNVNVNIIYQFKKLMSIALCNAFLLIFFKNIINTHDVVTIKKLKRTFI
jgi:hypothetical protein